MSSSYQGSSSVIENGNNCNILYSNTVQGNIQHGNYILSDHSRAVETFSPIHKVPNIQSSLCHWE